MATPSAFTQYSTVGNAYQRMMGGISPRSYGNDQVFSTGGGGGRATSSPPPGVNVTVQSGASGPINYDQPTSSLRPYRDITKISTFSDLSPDARIRQKAENKYMDLASSYEAQNMFARQQFADTLSNVGQLPKSDQSMIFEGYRNAGLLPARNADRFSRAGDPVELQQRQFAGAQNRSRLLSAGINPSSINRAYSRFLGA